MGSNATVSWPRKPSLAQAHAPRDRSTWFTKPFRLLPDTKTGVAALETHLKRVIERTTRAQLTGDQTSGDHEARPAG